MQRKNWYTFNRVKESHRRGKKKLAMEVAAAVSLPHLLVSSFCVIFWRGSEYGLFSGHNKRRF